MDAHMSPILSALSDDARTTLLSTGVERRWRRGSVLFLTGDSPERLYLVGDGIVKLARRNSDGRELIISLAAAGELVGELAAFETLPHDVDAIAATPVRALSLDAQCFRRVMAREPAALRGFVADLGRRYRALAACVHERGTATVPARLASRLLEMALLFGRADDDALEFEIPLRQTDIASFAGTSRESVSKTLKRFEAQGLVRCRGRTLRIVRPAALEKIRCAGRA
ncbi:MAG TPA: Crp/Fnr family transcriptional regulator [Actinomycetota bacterium]|nr:Crp/Fnr family transcriptional regulator [Actinomycetota bacterium]